MNLLMDFATIASHMWPCWVFGALIFWMALKAGHKNDLRVEPKAVFSWIKFLFIIALYRFVIFRFFSNNNTLHGMAANILQIPTLATLTVAWEDLAHGLPLLLLQRLIGIRKLTWSIHFIATLFIMIAFGLGHTYQGTLSAIILSFYIPFSVSIGKKHGFGTVMICHTLYDLSTILSLKYILGA